VHIKRQNLVLAPLNIVLVLRRRGPIPGAGRMSAPQLYAKIDVSRSNICRATSRSVAYAQPQVAPKLGKLVPRNRVKIWTQDQNVMVGWHAMRSRASAMERQDSLWSWTQQIVDFRVRRGKNPRADCSNPRGASGPRGARAPAIS